MAGKNSTTEPPMLQIGKSEDKYLNMLWVIHVTLNQHLLKKEGTKDEQKEESKKKEGKMMVLINKKNLCQ